MSVAEGISKEIAERLGYYVYALLDPRHTPSNVFYVGKGRGIRVLQHERAALEEANRSDKLDMIREIISSGQRVQHLILRHGLTEDVAFEIEAAFIDFLPGLTNVQGGLRSKVRGITRLEELIRELSASKLVVDEPVVLIRIQKRWRRGMSDDELLEATRACWKISPTRARTAKFVLAIADGIVRKVFRAESWIPCRRQGPKDAGRWEFEGRVAAERRQWEGTSVAHLFRQGDANPIRYEGFSN